MEVILEPHRNKSTKQTINLFGRCSIEMRPTYATSHLFERAPMIVLVFYICALRYIAEKKAHRTSLFL